MNFIIVSMKPHYFLKNLFFLFIATGTTSFDTSDSHHLKNNNSALAFSANGLHYETLLTSIFRGDFIDIPFDRDESIFALFLNEYIDAYAIHCASSLPANKIELTRSECVTERVTKDAYGWEISRTCIEWIDVGRNLFATPEMTYAKKEIERVQTTDALRNMFKMMNQKNLVGEALSLVEKSSIIKSDMAKLVKMNDCKSEGLMRFQENLRLFALNKQPIRLNGNVNHTATITVNNQNFSKLAEDLVYEHSKTWAINRYQKGSISNIAITSKDNQNRPKEMTAKYIYSGWSGKSTGSVRITFTEGQPECLYFFDFPKTCRTADRRIASKFLNGAYQK